MAEAQEKIQAMRVLVTQESSALSADRNGCFRERGVIYYFFNAKCSGGGLNVRVFIKVCNRHSKLVNRHLQ